MGLVDRIKRRLSGRKQAAAPGDPSAPPPDGAPPDPYAKRPLPPWRKAIRFVLPVAALLILLGTFVFSGDFANEIQPGEVGVIYNMSGMGVFGDDVSVVKDQGVQMVWPFFERLEKLDIQPQIFVMEGESDVSENHVRKLTVRASDGSNFYFEKLEIHYQIIPSAAATVIRQNGPGDSYKEHALWVNAREILRNEFGRYSFLEIADPRTYGEATAAAKTALNARLHPLGIEVTNIPPPKPSFDQRVEVAIEERQNAEQEVEVQQEKRNKLEQEKGRRVQQIEQEKNGEYQALVAELEAKKQQALNRLIAVKREADKYFIQRQAEGEAYKNEKMTRAEANKIAYQREAEGMVAKIRAVGESGPDVLNREIAEHVFPQLSKIKAVPYAKSSTPIDIRHLEADKP
ncbi:MAG: SPFH domain-containing protein [Myxococcota bacterium]